MKFIVADDSTVMRQIVMRALRQAGFDEVEVLQAANGKEGLELAQANSIDLILSDWNMPEMSGIEFLEQLRASGNKTTFGFVTSEGSPQMQARAGAAGASFLITKPFTPEAFREALNAVLGVRR